ncbi:DUF3667 domain-containing protein [Ekhidna sp.]|uniref:DUF3667 domain-containing protein n=1 Tax=Ekhidna sp. TaxID=2608089 RepID=UPI0035125B9E
MRHIGHQILDSIDFDRGFFHTLYLLLKQPGKAVRNFILGSRVGFANPFKLFLIVGAITNFLTYEFDTFSHFVIDVTELRDLEGYYRYSTKYFSFFTFTAIPLFSLCSWIIFYKKTYNLIEHYILNLYIGVGQFLVLIIFIPIIHYFPVDEVTLFYGFINAAYNTWVLTVFFQTYSVKGIVKIVLAIAIPSIAVFYYNYLIYSLSPQSLWAFLDRILA